MMKQRNIVGYLLIVSILTAFISASISGKVVGVSDGDTVTLLDGSNNQYKIRLNGVDCPEKSQAYGQAAKKFSSDFCFGKDVVVEYTGKDRYGRYLGDVIYNKKRLSEELLKAGLAWHYKHYNKSEHLSNLEIEAKKKKVGLWAQSNPVAPWEYRHSGKKSTSTTSTVKTSKPKQQEAVSTQVMICNSKSAYAYHSHQCSGLSRCKSGISKLSQTEAVNRGYQACKVCY